jgi:ABC-type oligopeptide transport system substrate-binding subunit
MKTKFRSLALLSALAAIAVLVIAGCGGGGSSSSGSGTTPSEGSSGFVSAAEAACGKANGAIIALGTPQQEQVTKYIDSTEELIERLAKEVAAAEPSSSAETAYAEGLQKAVPELTKMGNAARNENFDAVRELSAGLVEIHLGELAENAGLKSCAEVPVSEE